MYKELFDFPFKQAAGELGRLVDLEFNGRGLHGLEVHLVGDTLVAGVAFRLFHRHPFSGVIPIIDAPCVGHTASAPGLVVEPPHTAA